MRSLAVGICIFISRFPNQHTSRYFNFYRRTRYTACDKVVACLGAFIVLETRASNCILGWRRATTTTAAAAVETSLLFQYSDSPSRSLFCCLDRIKLSQLSGLSAQVAAGSEAH